ncbi:hypothetical protein BDW02DRAFT_565204 [Decorospora gaudefroyi]|uniref:C2H2-type domain-containing protein n=1 Tax=Decorospora gaudefroyi TaxID=184978 RepID=A0A6A5KWX8_9PLEO|nr:hypothetical protein BDW02DRAFT_565204 [Decorospora gaudefroyi]
MSHGRLCRPPASSKNETAALSHDSSISLSHSSPYTPQRSECHRPTSPSPSCSADPVIGQVTLSGKFKCLDPECDNADDLTFGRQADFKRHYENVHAGRSVEYFCPKDGCPRSKRPGGGKSKGRSFKGRKDKMNEHLRTVHHADKKKKRKMGAEDCEDSDGSLDDKRLKDGVPSRRKRRV